MSNAIVIIAILSVVFMASLCMVLLYTDKNDSKKVSFGGRTKVGKDGIDAEISIDIDDTNGNEQKSKRQVK